MLKATSAKPEHIINRINQLEQAARLILEEIIRLKSDVESVYPGAPKTEKERSMRKIVDEAVMRRNLQIQKAIMANKSKPPTH